MRGAGRTTPPHRAPVACGLGTLCRTCGASWNFASAWRYNHTTWNFVGTLRYFLDICEIFAIQPTPTAPRSSVARVSGLPMVARPLARSSRFFVSPLIGGAQQRGLRPRHSPNVPHPSPPKPRRTEGDGSPNQVAGAPPRESGAYAR